MIKTKNVEYFFVTDQVFFGGIVKGATDSLELFDNSKSFSALINFDTRMF